MVTGKDHNARSRKWIDLGSFGVWLVVIVLLNFLGSFVFHRFDLTEEGRYTLSETTVDQLENLEDVVFVRVYLDGETLPTEFRELRDATREILDEFRAYADDQVQYEFINPAASPVEEERYEVYKELTRQGLQYTNLRLRQGDQIAEQIIFPGAIVSFRGRETPLQLLKSQTGATEQEMIASSIQQLEYEFMSALRKVSTEVKPMVAILEGEKELDALETADLTSALEEFYEVERIAIDQHVDALKGFDAVIVARPDTAFTEQNKFILDQYIMHGGKVLWLVDPVFARMDSLKQSNITMGIVLEHNLDDMLFKYGVRLNADLVMDLECISKPIVTGMIGNQPRQEFFPWFYEPLLSGNEGHPISANIDRVKTEFASTMDSVSVEGVRHTPLLLTSDQSRIVKAPTRISFNILREPTRYEMFNEGPFTCAMLLEGTFPSVFTNRLPQKLTQDKNLDFRESSEPTKMIVISDGDIARNPVDRVNNQFYALGFDRYTRQMYGNREFLLNAMNYLCDDSGLLNVRAKEFKIRLLDAAQVDEDRYYWQALNTALPIALVFMLGVVLHWWRRKKYVTRG